MNTETKQTTLDSFCHGSATILGLESALSGKPVDAEWAKKVALWKTGLFRIVVMGEIKKGKSSFINALLGHKDLVPVCSDVATSTIFKICYGPEVGYKVFFHKASGKVPVSVGADELVKYGTENGNPGNEKQVEFIQVFCPSPLLKAGLVIVDTPGLGGLFKQHKRITYEYVPKADAVFLVTDSVESPIEQKELDLLADLKKVTKHIFFVQTKSRLVDAYAREARKANNLSILTQAGFDNDKIKYFVVDSATKFVADEEKDLKKLDRSGFREVAEFVNGYIRPNVHRLLIVRGLAEIQPKVGAISRELDAQEAILRTKTDEDRNRLISDLQEEQQKIKRWEESGKAELRDKIETGLSEIKKKGLARLNRFRPQGELSQWIEEQLDGIESIEKMQECVDGLQVRIPEQLTSELHSICTDSQNDCCRLLAELSADLGRELHNVESFGTDGTALTVSHVRQKLSVDSTFNNARNVVYGGFAGLAIAEVAGGIIGSVVPVVGTILGSFAGGALAALWGGWAAHSYQRESQLEAAKSKAKGAISGWLSNCHADMVAQFADVFDKLRRHVMHEIESGEKSLRDDALSRIAELKQMGQKSREEIAAKTSDLKKRRVTFSQALSDMGISLAVTKEV
ncbi:MAG: dynamin family protein [Paludibacteraceae bacterium]|nr:dynamin family protein [Paludibacteraceae bacterium]